MGTVIVDRMWAIQEFGVAGLLLLTVVSFGHAAPPTGRVVNGTDSSVQRYPFVFSLRGSSGSHSCGGSIISARYGMTAAHCTAGRLARQLSIQYGVTDINAAGPNVVQVQSIIQHENYSPSNSYANDIALLLVAEAFKIDGVTVAPVQLPPLDFETPQTDKGGAGVLIGWGLDKTGGTIQKTLQEVALKIYSNEQCNKRHNGGTNTKYHICGGVDEGGKGQCSGDSGGPLLFEGMQVGIVSWSVKPCTVAPYPGVYAKVSKYVGWIKKNQNTLA